MSINIDELALTLERITLPDLGPRDISRLKLQKAVSRLLSRLQTPVERAWSLMLENPGVFAAIQTCLRMGVFEHWNEAGGNEVSLTELCALCTSKPEPNLLRRLFRLLSSVYILEEVGEDRWKPTAFSTELGKPEGFVVQTMMFGTYHIMDPVQNLPEHLARTSFREPLDPQTGNYQEVYGGVDFFARLQSDLNYQKSFINGFQIGLSSQKIDWTEVYDPKVLVDGFDGGVCLVDLGGAHGLDAARLLAKYPDLPQGSLVIQDLPDVISLAKVDSRISLAPHDFMKPQPIKGSRAYFTHAVIHDWNDDDARKLLGHIAQAMKKGYSKLLLYECVIPSTGAEPLLSSIDIGIMYACSTAERSETAWKKLLADVGLTIVRVWKHPVAYESIIEAELA